MPVRYHAGKCLAQVNDAILRLVRLHGGEFTDERVIKLVIHKSSDGKYLAKGGRPKVWKRFGLRKEHRCLQGLVSGKRCGTTQNIGPAARIGADGRPETSLVENVGAGQIRSSGVEMWEDA